MMSEVNSSNLLSPVESLPRYHDDDEHQIIARKVYDQQVRKRLESLDASSMSFQGTGEVEVVMKIGGNRQKVSLPIRSIPADKLVELSAEYQEVASRIPRSWNPNGGEWDADNQRHRGTWDQDPSHPKFSSVAMELNRLTRKLTLDKVLYGLDIPLKDNHGNVVWDPDDDGIGNYDEAITALKRLKLSEEQLTQIETAIDNLSTQIEIDDEEEFTKK
jgi:hypothetical protein